jgi:predicted kinase
MTDAGADPVLDLLAGTPAVVVLVGTSGSGKTTLRRRLLAEGLAVGGVVSLDDLRREARDHVLRRGGAARPLQDYSATAVRRARRRSEVFAAFGCGYVADATHLRRRDRREHVAVASDAGLPAVAVLMPLLDVEELVRRNAARPPDEQVPADALLRQHHRRSLLSADGLLGEGFVTVHTPFDGAAGT